MSRFARNLRHKKRKKGESERKKSARTGTKGRDVRLKKERGREKCRVALTSKKRASFSVAVIALMLTRDVRVTHSKTSSLILKSSSQTKKPPSMSSWVASLLTTLLTYCTALIGITRKRQQMASKCTVCAMCPAISTATLDLRPSSVRSQ